jgi:antagonist of KipI
VLAFGGRRTGTRAYVAFDGGIGVPAVLGSRSTHVFSGLGGVEGRAVRAGDRLPLGDQTNGDKRCPPKMTPDPIFREVTLRILPGPQADQVDSSALDDLERQEYVISSQSDRMGYRLTGGLPLRARTTGDMISDVTFAGALQMPPSGDPILLMADRQTTGGYPQVAIVISADLPAAGQLAPGDRVRFRRCTRHEAVAALLEQEGRLLAIG